ncbi:MAG: ATP-binding cassette domain-containing protein, partial [Collinsella sp.]
IIGGTGSGKSTLVSLIPRLYDTSTGSVSVMGADVRTWPLDQLRRVVATVPQRASLVSGTIRSNLTWRDESATDEELWAALDMAQASEFVRNKPQGLDAPVEAGGKNFSGGQRQRLTIARALVGAPQILIMDDSASALDFKTDAAPRHAIRERSVRGAAEGGLPLTTVIVSQRVSTVRDADMICVLDHGSVAGLGTHDELYATCQLYREICQSQLRREELEGQQGSTAPASAPTVPALTCAKEGC